MKIIFQSRRRNILLAVLSTVLILAATLMAADKLTPVYRIACGRDQAVGAFAKDSMFSGGKVYCCSESGFDTADVPNSVPESLYRGGRFSEGGNSFLYLLPNLTPGGQYVLRLHFAEGYYPTGGRVFNVSVNRKPILKDFDIVAAAGAKNRAMIKQFTVNADNSGNIRIIFDPVKADPYCSGIELLKVEP